MSRKTILALAIAVVIAVIQRVHAQEVSCTVQVNMSALSGEYADKLKDFGSVLEEYVNRYDWGGSKTGRRIRCTVEISILVSGGSGSLQSPGVCRDKTAHREVQSKHGCASAVRSELGVHLHQEPSAGAQPAGV